ncbi:MAG: efflux RND transporter periplasmic adaptor subunit [Desulfobacterales bacterium]|nr:efflux RND transporter periplasmic adaptor subunit [Desulfobacterales bacterium]
MKINSCFTLMLAVPLLLGTAGCDSPPTQSKDQSVAAAAEEVVTVYAYGIVEARRHSTLSAKFPGKIEKILVREGEPVHQGQLLARFEARELEVQVEVARAAAGVAEKVLAEAAAGARAQEIDVAREQLNDAEARLAKTSADWERYQQLRAVAAAAPVEWERFRLQQASALARRNVAIDRLRLLEQGTRPETMTVLKQRLELARAEIERAEAILANASLTAPYEGVITRKHREEGEALDIGMPVMDIATLTDRYVRAEIDETDIGRIRVDQAARITADGFPGLAYNGRVVEIRQQMGPKKLIPTDPAKIIDYKVLDVEVSLPKDCPFPIKLPVNVRISIK